MKDTKTINQIILPIRIMVLVSSINLLTVLTTHLLAQSPDKLGLLKNVHHVMMPDTPNYICATFLSNEQPQIIVTGKAQKAAYQYNAIVTSRLDKGKIILFGSDQYFKNPLLYNKDNQQLLLNTLQWAKNKKKKKIQIWSNDQDISTFIDSLTNNKSFTDTVAIGKEVGILILTKDITDSLKINRIEQFVRNGGVLIFGSPLAGIISQNKLDYYELHLNTLFKKAGCYHIAALIDPVENNYQLNIGAIPPYLHISTLLEAFKSPGFTMKKEELEAYANTIRVCLSDNKQSSLLTNRILNSLGLDSGKVIIPSPQKPVFKSDLKNWLAYQIQQFYRGQQLEEHPNPAYIDPASKIFPGEVDKDAKRTNEQVVIPVQVGNQGLWEPYPVFYRWHSTGLYVVAGDIVTVTVGSEYLTQHLKAQIGVHDDNVSHLSYFTRTEADLTKTFELTTGSTQISSPFGGILLITIPDTSSLKTITIQVKGAIKYPYFKMGETSNTDWKNSIRNYPCPWAELATDKIILTVPSYRIRKLEDPEKLMKFWDEVMDADATLAHISTTRVHPERIIVDREVAYGALFTSPAKIVAPDDENCKGMLDETFMRENGLWGQFHELGHRHQFWGIDFSELGEVTENLYSMYVFDKVLHKGIYNHVNISSKEAVINNIKNYMANKPDFTKWGQDPFIALSMYIELIDGFGWQPIQQVFEVYRKLPKAAYPVTQADKRDYWFVNICAATQKDLSAFFSKWEIPITEKSKESVHHYPTWLPDELK